MRPNVSGLFYIAMRRRALAGPSTSQTFDPNMYGGRPHFHKTYKGADRHKGRNGIVLALHLADLPTIADVEVTPSSVTTELEFAERQIVKWALLADSIRRDEARR